MSKAGFEIRTRRSPLKVSVGIIISALVIATVSYLCGYWQGGLDNAKMRLELADQDHFIAQQSELLVSHKRDLTQLDQGRKVDEVAIDGVKFELKEQQQEMLELREEIAFYRGIVSPSEARTGILIQRFELLPLAEERLFQYRLVLTQVLKNERVARGVVTVFVVGVKEGRSQRIALQELSDDVKKELIFRFKYFQMFEGDLAIPEGFIPHLVEVEVKPRKSRSSINENFPWLSQEADESIVREAE